MKLSDSKAIMVLIIVGIIMLPAFAKAEYVDNGNGTVTGTDLMWQQADDSNLRLFLDAYQYCEDLVLAGYDDWRMPEGLLGLLNSAPALTTIENTPETDASLGDDEIEVGADSGLRVGDWLVFSWPASRIHARVAGVDEGAGPLGGDVIELNEGSISSIPKDIEDLNLEQGWNVYRNKTGGSSLALIDDVFECHAYHYWIYDPVYGLDGPWVRGVHFGEGYQWVGLLANDYLCYVRCVRDISNYPPSADAGPDQMVEEGDTVTLNGSNSSDPDDGIASYLWEQTDGTSVTLSDTTAVQPTFIAPNLDEDGEALTFQLTVTDNGGLQSTDTCIVNVTGDNDPPTANSGPDQTVEEGVTVTLDGSNSSDPDDGIASYQWTQTAGTSVTLSDSTAAQPTFTAPNVDDDGEALTFQLTVTDNGGLQSSDTCIVNVTGDNDPPVSDAGPDQTVEEGTTVTLDGSNSFDPDDGIHRYLWSQTVGTPVTLSDTTAVQPTFVTPPVHSNGTQLEFLLSIIDNGGLEHTDKVSIDVKDNGITDFPDDVVSTESSTGQNIGIKVESGGSITSFMMVIPSSLPDTTDMPEDFIYGLIDIEAKPDTAGGTVKVTVYLANPAPEGYKWYKYGTNDGWYDFSDYAEFNEDRDQVTLTLIDGGIGDDDGVANGVIVDPSGLGVVPSTPTPPDDDGGNGEGGGETGAGAGDGGGGAACFIATAAFSFVRTF